MVPPPNPGSSGFDSYQASSQSPLPSGGRYGNGVTYSRARTAVILGMLGIVPFSVLTGIPAVFLGLHASVTRALLAAGVVDELRLVVAPTIAGSGQRLFDGLPPLRLELIRGVASPSGYLLVQYRVAP